MEREKVIHVQSDKVPNIIIRVIDEDNDSALTKKSKCRYPFELTSKTTFTVTTTRREFYFTIPKGYCWNGADIPPFIWWVGASKDNEFLLPSLVHDYLLEFKTYIYNNNFKDTSVMEYKRITSLIFRQLLKESGTSDIKANLMSFAVDAFQSTLNRGSWNIQKKGLTNGN